VGALGAGRGGHRCQLVVGPRQRGEVGPGAQERGRDLASYGLVQALFKILWYIYGLLNIDKNIN
jgi:hypothetical protein